MTQEIKFRALGWPLAFTLEDILYEEDLREYLAKEKPIIRRYTGLKDKNGVEIYEGDIVKCRGYKLNWGVAPIDEPPLIAPVEYRPTAFIVGEQYLSFNDIEVIGNIYENPELVEPA